MDMRGPREVALLELGLHVMQVFAHPLNLLHIRHMLGDNSLPAPVAGLRENMRRCLEAERHHVSTEFCNFGLAWGLRQRTLRPAAHTAQRAWQARSAFSRGNTSI